VEKMWKRKGMGIVLAILFLGALTANAEVAKSDSSLEAIKNELRRLQKEYTQLNETIINTKDISIETRLEAAKFKEEVLYRLGLWRGKLAEGLITTIEAREIARRAQEQLEINKRLQASIEELKTEVSLAKEMAASAKIQADQAIRETRELAKQTQEKTDMILAKVDEVIKRVRELEKRLGKKATIKLKSTGLYEIKAKNIYEVKKGDSLWRIAGYKNIYNDPSKWRKIYEANKDRIGDIALIYPGQKLVIPSE